MLEIMAYLIAFMFGLLLGSFLNVCIYRIPKNESIAVGRSHCMKCRRDLSWYELFPLISFLALGGKCRTCKTKLSFQYPFIEFLNGLIYLMVFYSFGWDNFYLVAQNVLICFVLSTLLVLSVIDFRTKIIPNKINLFFFLLALVSLILRLIEANGKVSVIYPYMMGFLVITLFLLLLFYGTGGKGIGGGDVKLMAGAGLLLGWKLVLLSFFLGCFFATVFYFIQRIFRRLNHVIAFGPYLALGITLSLFYGRDLIDWYIRTFLSY